MSVLHKSWKLRLMRCSLSLQLSSTFFCNITQSHKRQHCIILKAHAKGWNVPPNCAAKQMASRRPRAICIRMMWFACIWHRFSPFYANEPHATTRKKSNFILKIHEEWIYHTLISQINYFFPLHLQEKKPNQKERKKRKHSKRYGHVCTVILLVQYLCELDLQPGKILVAHDMGIFIECYPSPMRQCVILRILGVKSTDCKLPSTLPTVKKKKCHGTASWQQYTQGSVVIKYMLYFIWMIFVMLLNYSKVSSNTIKKTKCPFFLLDCT